MYLTSLYRGVKLALFACLLACLTSVVFAQSVSLSGHLPPILGSAQRIDRVAAEEQVSLALVLPLRNQDQLTDLLHRLYTPGDLMYGKYLTSDQFAQQFSPTPADYNVVLAFAQAQGLTVTNTSSNRTVVDVVGSAQTVENAFGVQLNHYQVAGGRVFRAPSNEPQIPVQLVGRLAAVVGLDTAAVWKTHNKEKTDAAVGGHFLADPRQIGSGPGGGLAPSDIKTAYNLNAIGANGSGQTLAVFELTGYKAGDISGYESYFGLPSVPLQNVLVDTANGSAGSGQDEVTLDIELQIALAPAAAKIYVYEGPNSNIGVLDTYNRIAFDNLAKSVSTSWGLAEGYTSSSVRNSENQAFQQMATQGQSIFAASGDSGAYDNGSTVSVDDPASQPYMTGVGGTSLNTTGAGGAWSSETTWNNGSASAGAGGGGVSTVWSKPSWQSTYGTSSTFRNVPDVSLDANPGTGYSIYLNGSWTIYGGTSCSAPLWSAFVACVNQSRVAVGKGTLGFANPLLYTLGASANYATDFHDITDNSTNLFYHATTGFDNATGWGTINGTGLFPDLVNGAPLGTTNTSAVYQIDCGGGAVGSFSADTLFNGGTLYSVGQSVSTAGVTNAAPAGVYQSLRYGNFSYNFPTLTPGANYTVRLHFAEVVFTAPGRRVFNVTVNGATALSNFDIYAAAGANKALVKDFSAVADSNGKINIQFITVVNNAQVNGIEIISGGSGSTGVPAAPMGVTATAGNAQISLAWTAVSGASSYKVYRSLTSGSGYTSVGTPTATNYVDGGLTNGTTYYYVVTALNANGESANSSQVSATPALAPALYQIDSGGGAVGTFIADNYFSGGGTFSVNQTIDVSGANSAPMAVYQSLRYGNFTYSIPDLTPGASYTVRLHFAEIYFANTGKRIFNVAINGTTVLSKFDICAVVGANKALVKDFSATADSTGAISLNFGSVVDNAQVNGIEIISSGSGGSGLSAAPTGLTAAPGNTSATLSWTAVPGASSYKVYRSTVSGSGYTSIGTAGAASYVDSGLTNGTTYYYVVTAVNASGESPNSNQASATPAATTALYQIKSGGGAIGAFSADNYFIGGNTYADNQTVNTSGVANAAPMAVYQTMRYGNFAYNMPNLTPGMSYTVRLHFAETVYSTPGQRFFNVAINGSTVLSNFDIATTAGSVNKALVEQFTVQADSGGNIFIAFTRQTDWPLVNAVEVVH